MAVRWKSVKKFDLIDQAVPFLKISFSFAHRQYGGIVRGMGCMNVALHLYVQAQACGAPVLKLLWIGRGRRELFFFMIYTSDASWGRENHSYRFHAAEWSTWSWSRVSKCQFSLNFLFFCRRSRFASKISKKMVSLSVLGTGISRRSAGTLLKVGKRLISSWERSWILSKNRWCDQWKNEGTTLKLNLFLTQIDSTTFNLVFCVLSNPQKHGFACPIAIEAKCCRASMALSGDAHPAHELHTDGTTSTPARADE